MNIETLHQIYLMSLETTVGCSFYLTPTETLPSTMLYIMMRYEESKSSLCDTRTLQKAMPLQLLLVSLHLSASTCQLLLGLTPCIHETCTHA